MTQPTSKALPRAYLMTGTWELDQDGSSPGIYIDDPEGGDPICLATLRRIYHDEKLREALAAAISPEQSAARNETDGGVQRSQSSRNPEQDGYAEGRREQIARIVNPVAFMHYGALLEYCIHCGDTPEDARKVADDTHGPDVAKALAQAGEILALTTDRHAEGRIAGLEFVIAEAKRAQRLVQGCLECNADDERRWQDTINWLEGLR